MGSREFYRKSRCRREASRLRLGFPDGSIHGRGWSLASGRYQKRIEGWWCEGTFLKLCFLLEKGELYTFI